VFIAMVLTTAALGLFGYLKVRRIRGPQQTIESVKETRSAFSGETRSSDKALKSPDGKGSPNGKAGSSTGADAPSDPSGW
jgi:hypothetical protein